MFQVKMIYATKDYPNVPQTAYFFSMKSAIAQSKKRGVQMIKIVRVRDGVVMAQAKS